MFRSRLAWVYAGACCPWLLVRECFDGFDGREEEEGAWDGREDGTWEGFMYVPAFFFTYAL